MYGQNSEVEQMCRKYKKKIIVNYLPIFVATYIRIKIAYIYMQVYINN